MKRRLASASLFLFAFTLLHAQDTASVDKSLDMLVGNHLQVHQIFNSLQQSVAAHDAAGVAALVHYPLKVNPGNRPFTVHNEKAFVKDYDRIITPDIAAAIEKQKYENLFVNSQGAMIGDGEVWITSICLDKRCTRHDIKIGTIQDAMKLKP